MSTTAPVVRDNFSFANGDLFARVSGNFHRRCGVAELKSYFDNGSEKDQPVHWFSAQLIHYGLKPSNTKAVSRMRLYDAVCADKLAVPATIAVLENDMRKEWVRNERDAKKANKSTPLSMTSLTTKAAQTGKTAIATNSSLVAGTKRKATQKVTAQSPSIKKPKSTIASTISAGSKANSGAPKTQPNTPSTCASKSTSLKKKLGSNGGLDSSHNQSILTQQASRPKQTARCSRGGASTSRGRGGISTSARAIKKEVSPPRKTQTARRGGARGRASASGVHNSCAMKRERNNDCGLTYHANGSLSQYQGLYELESYEVSCNWGHRYGSEFELELTFNGSVGSGRFDLGVIVGVLKFDQPPSREGVLHFIWRGREAEGEIIYGNSNKGWLELSPQGDVDGRLDYMNITFSGRRIAPVDGASVASRAQIEWENEYTQTRYEHERVNRW